MSFNDNVNDNSKSGAALTIDDAADAILGNWEDAAELSDDEQEATDETTDETDVEDSDIEDTDDLESAEDDEDPEEDDTEEATEDDQEEEQDESEAELVEFDDDTLVEISVDGESKQASIKDLKRLYGQEASLTRKSQEAASQRKSADEQMQKADASLQAMISRAQERYKPYSEVDMLVASKNMSAEDFTQLRAESRQAEEDLKFLTEEADGFYGYVQQQQAQAQQEQAKECVQVLQREIPDWNNTLYNDIRQYAITNGLPEQAVNQYADPNVIMLLNKARMFDQTTKVATVKKAKAAKKVLRTKRAPPTKTDITRERQRKNVERLRSANNDLDNIADVIMSNWE
tara:strand:+ start:715 stop:1749 length:1035 start_codon:yes stop_codon:yes gene_type:complete